MTPIIMLLVTVTVMTNVILYKIVIYLSSIAVHNDIYCIILLLFYFIMNSILIYTLHLMFFQIASFHL